MSSCGQTHDQSFVVTVTADGDDDAAITALLQGDDPPATNGKWGRCISAREYYAYRFQIRIGNYLLRAGRLFLQFIVDMYVKIENTRLDFFRKNQKKNKGRIISRDLSRRYLNAITLVQRFGKPDLFVTMTCNPNWPEIKAEIAPGEKAQDRPDLVARVFREKLIALKKKITDEFVFGEVATFIYVVEFQKRGLPHVYMLIILKQGYKIKEPALYDKFTCAEIPSNDNPHLRKIVLRHMMHGPCGKDDPSCPCMNKKGSEGKCKYGYPKAYNDTTTNNDSGYPAYCRHFTGESTRIRGRRLDNQWVIPYNPYLSALFDCHLNVEICSTIQAVKYLYKYVYKGHDICSFTVTETGVRQPVDEIKQFQSSRWVSPCEAAWRIFSFDLYEMSSPVLLLQVHLPNQHSVRFNATDQLEDVVADSKRARTSLTEFFKMNAAFLGKPKYLLAFVSPSEGGRYFLRLLLTHVRGPTSFEDLRTVNGFLCATFQEAAVKLGLLSEDDDVEKCMDEAATAQMPRALRRLFATLLIFGNPRDPLALWHKYYTALCEDYSYSLRGEEQKVKAITVREVERYLEEMGLTRTKDIVDALNAPIPNEYVEEIATLNSKQREAFTAIMSKVNSEEPGAFFIDGPGGRGKTYLYCALYAAIRQLGKIVLPTAT
ncbi:uncharacterized protein LOC110688886 [Chenopodium quinoa]|uniref:uncharacterized protein LOC110688886 n=1 Tax=Chenopodium quinoa TaxID=63459 RepID=UPI000B7901DB|nr:uncharacterized protein LOC110688886 [Chenopodium quinoa]